MRVPNDDCSDHRLFLQGPTCACEGHETLWTVEEQVVDEELCQFTDLDYRAG